MKRIIYGETSWLIGDDAADTVLQFAVELAQRDSAAAIDLTVLDAAGAEQTVRFLIGPATMMMAESTGSSFPEPDNTAALDGMRDQLDLMAHPPNAAGAGERGSTDYFGDL
jgi:hypothetical protein